MVSHEELKAQYPPDDAQAYQDEYARAALESELVELFVQVRTHAGLSQAELAERMGTTEETVAEYEDFDTIPTVDVLAQLSRATGVPLRLVAGEVASVDLGADRTP